MNEKNTNYNLLVEHWIPVLRTNGQFERVGINTALLEAGTIRQIAASNPMDNVAFLRLLLAVLQWRKPEPKPEELAKVGTDGKLVEGWFEIPKQYKDRFDLFDAEHPFYQDPSLPDKVRKLAAEAVDKDLMKRKKTVSSEERRRRIEEKIQDSSVAVTNLIQELPSGSNIAHFRHTHDYQDGLCFTCCAHGLLRWSSYAAAGTFGSNAQMPAGINGANPTYSIPVGSTLLETLLTNWPLKSVENDVPAWEDAGANPTLGPLRGLTWLPRQILLAPPHQSGQRRFEQGVCVWCAQGGYVIRRILFRPGRKRPYDKKPWPDDPHILRAKITIKQKTKPKEVEFVPSLPQRDAPLKDHADVWRDIARGLLQRQEWPDAADRSFQTFMMSANKALYQQAVQQSNALPEAVSRWSDSLVRELDWLSRLDFCIADPRADRNSWGKPPKGNVLVAKACTEDAKGHTVRAGLSVWCFSIERQLEDAFKRLMTALPVGDGDNVAVDAQESIKKWRQEVEEILGLAARNAVVPALAGPPLKRAETARAVADAVEMTVKGTASQRTQGSKRGEHDSD